MASFVMSKDGKTVDIIGLEIQSSPDVSTSGKTFNVVQFNGKTGLKVKGQGVLADGKNQPFEGELTCNCNAYVKNPAFVKPVK
jgi:hypothetical protein